MTRLKRYDYRKRYKERKYDFIMKITDKMFEELVNITKIMIDIHNYLEIKDKTSCKKANKNILKICYKLKKHYSWSNKKMYNFWNLAQELYGDYIGFFIIKNETSEEFFKHTTIKNLEKDNF